MSLRRKILGGQEPPPAAPADDADRIKVFDGYGRELLVKKADWKDNVLLGTLEKEKGSPETLYNLLVGALKDGFAADVLPYAEHLWRTDPMPSRGATVLGVTYMDLDRLDDAERVFDESLAAHGENGYVLANLAKVYDRRGDRSRAEATLWHALELDPNQEFGLLWYVAMHRERGGEPAALDAFRRTAAVPQSWRSRLYLARAALQRNDLAEATALYADALEQVGRPVPADFLMQMSGDLGNNGHLAEIVRLVEPLYDAAVHGLVVGNNLIKAHCDLGQTQAAKQIVAQLYARNRFDWQKALRLWETEIAKLEVAKQAAPARDPSALALLAIEAPLWLHDGSPFASLRPAKRADAPRVALFGSTVLREQLAEEPTAQLSDAAGRLSRCAPLLLTERIQLATDAVATALIPWVQTGGFAVFGAPYDDRALCEMAKLVPNGTSFVAGITLDTTRPEWTLVVRLLDTADGRRLGECEILVAADDPGLAVESLADTLLSLVTQHGGVRPTAVPRWYRTTSGRSRSDYLLRLEQQLAVMCARPDRHRGSLSGEHEILDGILQLCVSEPANALVRIVFAETLRHMKQVRPDILPEYRDRVALLRREHPLAGDDGRLIDDALATALDDRQT